MQNKGVIRSFAIIFALACLYQLSFTYISSAVNQDAEAYAQGNAELQQAYLDSMRNEVVYDIGLDEFTYAEVKSKELNLGLDLKGGMNVILQVSVRDILRELVKEPSTPIFKQALAGADSAATTNQEDYLTNFFNAFERLREQQKVSIKYSSGQLFGTKSMNDRLGFNAADQAVKDELRSLVNASVENVYTVLRARIDQFGVVQPNIQRLDQSGRILVELPGVKDPQRVKKLLQSTAVLEFYELYEGAQLLNFLSAANEKLRGIVENPNPPQKAAADTGQSLEDAPEDLSFESVEESPQPAEDTNQENQAADSLLEQDDALVDSLASDNPEQDSAQQFNPLFRYFTPNYDFQNSQVRRGPVVGFAQPQDTADINQYLSFPQIRALLPADMRGVDFMWDAKPNEAGFLRLYAGKTDRRGEPAMTGDVVTNAQQDFDRQNNPIVNMNMNARGASRWQEITKEAAGQPENQEDNRAVAVVLDKRVYSAPVVQNEIPSGRTQISGNFTVQEAQDLANILQAGALPAPANIIQANIVGPSLGEQAIQAGLWSFVIALILVMVYMVFYYSGAGVASVIALVVNIFFIFGILASLGAVLTLPGIAGIVLTIGMSVDANVLIYERIREELANGKGLRLALQDGYQNAYSSIIDANVTTFLTGVILYSFGTGPIRGFATTLIIGILTSLFCAIFITRLVFEARLVRKKAISFATNLTRNAFTNTNINFLSKRRISYTISGLIILAGIVSLLTRGLNYGVDFVGGRSYQVVFDQEAQPSEIQNTLGDYFVQEDGTKLYPEVKTIGDPNQVLITTKYKVEETGLEVENDIKDRLYRGVSQFYQEAPQRDDFFSETEGDTNYGIVAERQVGPAIADDIRTAAFWALGFSLVVIFLYILIRFSRWQFSLGAVAAVFHDVLIVLSLFSLLYGLLPFSLEIDQAFIAALLTVIGYSLNDTVVVFDRIREFQRAHIKRRTMHALTNDALNATLSRTVNTSLTTLAVMLIIFIFGGETIRGFMFALLIGIIVGTYSSLFVATPVMIDSLGKEAEAENKKKVEV
jgi:SecD/SecF fusion protein